VRVTTAFNRMLKLPGASVVSVSFSDVGVVVGLRLRARRLRCQCGFTSRARYDSRRRRWRHLDAGACQLWLEAEIRRIDCPHCGVRTEQVPWARPGARHSRDFQDVVGWLCQRMDKTSVCRLLRCSWEAVDRIVADVVTDHLDESRLEDLYRVGVDEISYKRGHQYLTIVADHDTGRVVWIAKDRSKQALTSFYDALGEQRRNQLKAVSMDMSHIYRDATRDAVPNAVICFDPFHAMQWVNQALDAVFSRTPRAETVITSQHQWRRTRTALRTGAERLDHDQHQLVRQLRRQRYELFRAWELKEQFRALYRNVAPSDARRYLATWCTRAKRSKIRSFVNLARRIRNHFDGIVAAVEHGLSNSRLEGINSKIRLINNRAHGHQSLSALSNSIYLCLGGITIQLPTQR
jgi:transposase